MKSNKNVLIRAKDAGVFVGELVSRDGTEVKLKNARRIWYWDGAATLSELATKGTSAPQNCKFPAPVANIEVLGVCEIIDLTDEAKLTIDKVPVWTRH